MTKKKIKAIKKILTWILILSWITVMSLWIHKEYIHWQGKTIPKCVPDGLWQ